MKKIFLNNMNKKLFYVLGGVLAIGGVLAVYQKTGFLKKPASFKSQILQKEIKLEPGKAVCEQVPAAAVEGILGKKVDRERSFLEEPISICQYYFEDNDFLSISAGSLNYEEQKQGRQSSGREIKTNSKIATEHFVTMNKDGYVSDVVLKISDDYFLAIEFFNLKSMNFDKLTSEEAVADFTNKLIDYLQTGKIGKTSVEIQDSINVFFDLIGEGKAGEAVKMLSSQNISNEEMKKMWQDQFEAIKFVKAMSVEPVMKDSWTDKKQEYKVVLNMVIDESAKDALIPYYGYEQGENTRFIVLVKEGGKWLIESIATGP